MKWVLFAIYLNTSGAPLAWEGTPHNFALERDCLAMRDQVRVRMAERGVTAVHVKCELSTLAMIPIRNVELIRSFR